MSTKVTPLLPRRTGRKTASADTASSLALGPKRPLYAHLEPLEFHDEWGDVLEFVDFPAIALDYCHKTISGAWPACNYVKLACKRYLEMLKMAKLATCAFTFSAAHACDFLGFTEELPLVEDNFRGVERIELEPWQIFAGCAIYGFRDRRGFRYINEVYFEVPRKSAKSVLATAIAIYDVRNPEARTPLILIAASTLDQANRVFTPVRKTIEGPTDPRDPAYAISKELRDAYGLEATQKQVECKINSGTIEKVASIGERQDGWNPTTIILEELHAQNPDVYAVLKSAIGSRGGQLLFQITTAGRNAFGLAWDNRKAAIRVLQGHEVNWRHFAVIYTLDKEDLEDAKGNKRTDHLFYDERLWAKACPNLAVSFDIDAFRSLAKSALYKPSEREEYFRTRLNIWTNAATKLFDVEMLRRGADEKLDIEKFRGRKCWVGVDLSNVQDLTAVAAVFEDGPDKIAFFVKYFVSGDSLLLTDPDHRGMIRGWLDLELMSATHAGGVDVNAVENHIRWLNGEFDVMGIGFDPAMAARMMNELEAEKFPVVKFMQRAAMMTAPVNDLIERIGAQDYCRLTYDGNPVTEWCFSNVHGERKKDDTILPFKDAVDSLEKIDGAVAVAFANGLRLHPEYMDKTARPSVYGKRGLKGRTDGDRLKPSGQSEHPSRPPRYS